ncbi:hypothetical protein GCM10022246_10110 [Pedobacter ginsengiterrae]|uniref:ATP-binding protein n=1 Tax=Pedobacter ginsengiterrae TaxID=871696 RepID=A0ABP7P2A3_9SPHI
MKTLYSLQDAVQLITSDKHNLKVVIMCGLAGSGKTTFSQILEKHNFMRLSIDEEIWAKYGRYGIDYSKDHYGAIQTKAYKSLLHRFYDHLKCRDNIVVDMSFWQRKKRNEFKRIIESEGGKSFLIYMDTPISIIKKRLAYRKNRFDANSAFPITDLMLNEFVSSFEIPENEEQFRIGEEL